MSPFYTRITNSADDGLFGVLSTPEQAQIHVLPVPWEVTTSYGAGTAQGPSLIADASVQVDLFDLELGDIYELGIYMHPIPEHLKDLNESLKPLAQEIVGILEENPLGDQRSQELLQKVNQGSSLMTKWVYEQTKEILKMGKWPVVIGGDHSTPLGAIKAVSEHYKGKVGILHIDAHADLRVSYQGFHQSHASIMYNVLQLNPAPKNLVQVGIRDFCKEEYDLILGSPGKIKTFFDMDLKKDLFEGQTWNGICQQISSELPELIYVSFDIDGLDPALCPGTGTPVAGGLQWNEALYLLHSLHKSGKKIVGFDINEVSAGEQAEDEWNGNVGARLLYKMCGWLGKSQGLL